MSTPNLKPRRFLGLPLSIPAPTPGDTSTFVSGAITTDPLPTPLPSLLVIPSQSTPSYQLTDPTLTSTPSSILSSSPANLTNAAATLSTTNTSSHTINISLGAWLGIGLSLAILLVLATVYICLCIRKGKSERVQFLPDTEPNNDLRGRLGREARVVAGGTAIRRFEVTRRGRGGSERLEAEVRQMKRIAGAKKVVLVDNFSKRDVMADGKEDEGNRRGSRRYTDSLVDGLRKDQIGLALSGDEREDICKVKVSFGDDDYAWERERRLKLRGRRDC